MPIPANEFTWKEATAQVVCSCPEMRGSGWWIPLENNKYGYYPLPIMWSVDVKEAANDEA